MNEILGGCLMNGEFFPSKNVTKVYPDKCSTCTCHNESSVCQRTTCPVLECAFEYQKTRPGECCPYCPPMDTESAASTCAYKGVTYQVY